jgi:cysteine synthase A
MRVFDDITKTTGETPIVRLNRIVPPGGANVFCKLEFFNPASSIKDRIAVNMIDEAEKSGALKPGGVIIEPTSGNTGLGLAMVAAARGYKLVITMPSSMSIERRLLMEHFGAEIILTPAEDGMKGAVGKAEELKKEKYPEAYIPGQFDNPANPDAHYKHTAAEIWRDTDGKVDILVTGVGTGGTLTGIGKFLREKNKAVKIVAVEPATSAVLSGGAPGRHGIQGIGAGFIPKVLDRSLIDRVMTVSDNEAVVTAKNLARREGILCGISSGAAVSAALKLADETGNADKNIVVIIMDTGERYLSTGLFS